MKPSVDTTPARGLRAPRHLARGALAGLLLAAAMGAQAVGLSATSATGVPGGTATVSFDLGFDGSENDAQFYAYLSDAVPLSALTLVAGSVTWNGLDLSDPGVPAEWGEVLFAPDYTAALRLVLPDPPITPLTGTLRFSFTYTLSGLAAGEPAEVTMGVDYGFGTDSTSVAAQVTAVPEASTAALALAGLGVAGAAALRRDRPQARSKPRA